MKNNRTICQITTLHQANDNRIFRRECCGLATAGYEVHFIVPDSGLERQLDGVHIHPIKPINARLWRMTIMPWRAMKKALSIKADIYHYHDPDFMIAGFVMSVFLRKKVVFDIHESVPNQIMSKSWIPKWARKPVSLLYKIVETVFTKSQTLIVANRLSVADYKRKVYLVQNYPVLREDLIKLYDESKFNEKLLLVYVGGVAIERGADMYVELAGRLAQKGFDFDMKIIGWNCANTVERLSERTKQLGIENKIEYTGGIDWLGAMKLISRAHIGLCLLKPIPNYVTCLATKIIEYMMLGIPVLASDFDVWRPYVEGEKTGYMADPENIEEVVRACEKLLSDKSEMIRMAQRGISAVREKYNWSHEFKQLIECYNTLSD